MEENSSDNNTIVRASDLEKDHNSDGDGDVSSIEEDHDDDLMKNMISNHPLFELLIETHINCLKVGLGSDFEDEVVITTSDALVDEEKKGKLNASSSNVPTSELDKFMEVYCIALKKLKEAMEEPLKDATCFISNMYEQLNDLSATKHANVDVQSLIFNDDKAYDEDLTQNK